MQMSKLAREDLSYYPIEGRFVFVHSPIFSVP